MNAELAPAQALLVFGLLARDGASLKTALVPNPKPADVKALQQAKLVDVGKQGRQVLLSLTDTGWAWADSNLTAELPAAQATLHDWLVRLDGYLRQTKRTLAHVMRPAPKPRKRKIADEKPARPKTLAPAALRKRIEGAYLALTGGRRNEAVTLAELREELGDLDRAVVDGGLKRILAGDTTATLMRHDDPRQVRAADRAAAFAPAGEPYHLLWIAS